MTLPSTTYRVTEPRGKGSVKRKLPTSMPRVLLTFAIPALAFYVFILLVPTVQGLHIAFTDYDGISKTSEYVGFDNFKEVFLGRNSSRAILNTVLIAFAVTIFQNLIGLLLALGVHSRIKSRNILRVFFFATAVMTPVVTAYVWQFMLAPNGPVNALLDGLHLGSLKQNWLGDGKWALASVIILVIWQFSGYSMVIFLAGLQGVPSEVIEAAAVDGAGPVKTFFHIVRPFLKPALTINLMLALIAGFKLFDQVWVLTAGGPGGETNTLSTLIFRNAFQFNEYSTSIAMALVLLIMVAIVSGIQYRSLFRRDGVQ